MTGVQTCALPISYAQFNTEVTTLKNFFTTRRNYLLTNAEVSQVAPVISAADLYNAGGVLWAKPAAGESSYVKASVTSTTGILGVKLYYSSELTGNFSVVDMLDDGQHNDGGANDGVYGAGLPAQIAIIGAAVVVLAIVEHIHN